MFCFQSCHHFGITSESRSRIRASALSQIRAGAGNSGTGNKRGSKCLEVSQQREKNKETAHDTQP
eukprot:754217-Hanusia_phi.AAC.2